jgi:hypothetical protein
MVLVWSVAEILLEQVKALLGSMLSSLALSEKDDSLRVRSTNNLRYCIFRQPSPIKRFSRLMPHSFMACM